jgi:hypothetical protein
MFCGRNMQIVITKTSPVSYLTKRYSWQEIVANLHFGGGTTKVRSSLQKCDYPVYLI